MARVKVEVYTDYGSVVDIRDADVTFATATEVMDVANKLIAADKVAEKGA